MHIGLRLSEVRTSWNGISWKSSSRCVWIFEGFRPFAKWHAVSLQFGLWQSRLTLIWSYCHWRSWEIVTFWRVSHCIAEETCLKSKFNLEYLLDAVSILFPALSAVCCPSSGYYNLKKELENVRGSDDSRRLQEDKDAALKDFSRKGGWNWEILGNWNCKQSARLLLYVFTVWVHSWSSAWNTEKR